jgi:hypothetical protein
METATTVKAATSMKPATVKAPAMEAFTAESTAVESAAMKAAIKAPMKTTIEAPIEAAVKAAIKEAITIPEPKAPPWSGADEDTAVEPVRAVIAVGGAGVRVIPVIPVAADGGRAVIDGPPKSKAEGDTLGVRARGQKERDTENNAD